MNDLLLFFFGLTVTMLVFGAMGILVWGAIQDGRRRSM
jgi:hypothetical protein